MFGTEKAHGSLEKQCRTRLSAETIEWNQGRSRRKVWKNSKTDNWKKERPSNAVVCQLRMYFGKKGTGVVRRMEESERKEKSA